MPWTRAAWVGRRGHRDQDRLSTSELVEHYFRHEYGRLVATLTRRVGAKHLEAIEDATQGALMQALESWTVNGPPSNPAGWLFRVALNELLDELRRGARRERILADAAREGVAVDGSETFDPQTVDQDVLRMLFICCDEEIPIESRVALALKTLCGFSVKEVAQGLLTSEENVYKRLSRARAVLSTRRWQGNFSGGRLSPRLPAVHATLYLLFTEGHLSNDDSRPIRQELCDEAIRLTRLLVDDAGTRTPATCALLALMCLQAARTPGRQNVNGSLLLLAEQDRSLWNQDQIHEGLVWLAQSARGTEHSRYHAEAAIAAEHCLAPSLAATRWDAIVEQYRLLEAIAPSPLNALCHALALAELKGPAAGLALLASFSPPKKLNTSFQLAVVRADLLRRSGDLERASHERSIALRLAPTSAMRQLLERRLNW